VEEITARRRFAFLVALAGVLSLVSVGAGSGSRTPLLIAVDPTAVKLRMID